MEACPYLRLRYTNSENGLAHGRKVMENVPSAPRWPPSLCWYLNLSPKRGKGKIGPLWVPLTTMQEIEMELVKLWQSRTETNKS